MIGPGNRIHLVIALGVLLRSTHIALSVNGVVESPVGRRSNSHPRSKHGATFRHGHQRIPSTIRPAPDTNPALVYIALLAKPDGSLNLIARLQFTQPHIGTLLEICPTSACATIVHTDTNIALLTEILFENSSIAVHANPPLVEHLLIARTAILIHDDGILLRG